LCPVQCRVVIEDMIESAQYSVDIMTQYIYDDTILWLLKNLDPDIKLRLLLSDSDGNYDTLDYFGDELVTIHDSDAGYLHTKTILVDERWLLVWSMNLSSNSLDRNREIGLIITDPDMINYYVNHFEQLFQGLW
jgi:phosphatidylserine/phosphatidylglycerophosphate/cardiolipin synthase-like enzyme